MFTQGLKRTTLASQTYVDQQIGQNLPTGTIYEISVGTGLSITGGSDTITTVGELKFEAGLSVLTDVSDEVPLNNEILTWDSGTSMWRPSTFTGSGSSPLAWDNLTNVQSLDGAPYYIMKVNSSANEVELVQNQLVYAPGLVAGVGITHSTNQTNDGVHLRTDIDLSQVYTTTNSDSESTLVFVDQSDNQRRIRIGDVDLSDFANLADPYLQSSGISTVSPVVFESGTNTFYLNNERYDINFDYARQYTIVGDLPISAGGTSATNAEDARANLGLSYNSDVMTYQDPQFIGTMDGTDILIRPYYLDTTSLTVGTSGNGYDGAINATVELPGGTFEVDITTGASGQLVTVDALSQAGHQNYLDWNVDQTGTVVQTDGGGPNESGAVEVGARTGYINFGQTTGYDGYGIGYDGNFWFREKDGDWANNIPFNLTQATDVENTMISTQAGSVLVWDGVDQFTVREVSGAITMSAAGVTSFGTGTIDPTQIDATFNSGSVEIDRFEFGTLHDIRTGQTIQQQLDNGVSVTPPVNTGDLIYYDGDSWEVIPYSVADKVLVSTGLSAPSWDFVSTTYDAGTYSVGDDILFLDTSGTSQTKYTQMKDILLEHTGGTGGMAIPGSVLATDIAGLPAVSGFNTTDFVMAVNNPSISTPLDEQIGVSTMLGTFAGPGLTTSGGQFSLDTGTDIIPDTDVTYDLGSGSYQWQNTHTQSVFFDTSFATDGDITGSATAGRVVFLTAGDGGAACLAVHDGTSWKKVSLSSF